MIKVVCPVCKEEKRKYEIVKMTAAEKSYEVRCTDCGETFVVFSKDAEEQHS